MIANVKQFALGITLQTTPIGHAVERLQQRRPVITRRRSSVNIFDVRRTRGGRPRYTVVLTFNKAGQPVTALCVDQHGEQCKANEFGSCCYHVAGALCRFFGLSPAKLTVAPDFVRPDSARRHTRSCFTLNDSL